jgi:hypothetical protein
METPEKASADINIKLVHERQAAAWSVLRKMRRKTGQKIRIELRLLTGRMQYYQEHLEQNRSSTDKEFNRKN